jgi:hypothetical protein
VPRQKRLGLSDTLAIGKRMGTKIGLTDTFVRPCIPLWQVCQIDLPFFLRLNIFNNKFQYFGTWISTYFILQAFLLKISKSTNDLFTGALFLQDVVRFGKCTLCSVISSQASKKMAHSRHRKTRAIVGAFYFF